MSGIAGFLGPAGGAEADHLLARLADALGHRGTLDGGGAFTLHRPPVAMVQRPFHGTPVAPEERQPTTAPQEHRPAVGPDGSMVVWDGRLDRPPDGIDGIDGGPGGEPELVLAAHRRWGEGFADRLVGPFACALWDAPRRRLLLARDPFGRRPLFVRRIGERLFWASNLTALGAPAPATELDETWLAGYLSTLPPEDRTPYRAIRSVPPGCVAVVSVDATGEGTAPRGIDPRRYWPGHHLAEVRLRDDGEYEERFLGLLEEAVAASLRASGVVVSELSGGLDSSSITCLGDRLLRDGGVAARDLHACSYVFTDAPSSDESRHVDRVEAWTGRPTHRIDDRHHPLLDGFLHHALEAPSPYTTFRRRYEETARRMAASGARVLLSGIAGDDVGLSEFLVPPHLADLAAGGRLPTLVREVGRWQGEVGLPWWRLLWRGALHPLLPRPLRTRLGEPLLPPLPWLRDDFARRSGLEDLRHAAEPGPVERSLDRPSVRGRCNALRLTVQGQVHPQYLVADRLGIEFRYPFLHRPLVEFALAIPVEQHLRPGETRSLQRRALAGVLPPEIARRRDKAGPDEALMRALSREWPELQACFGGDARIYDAGIAERGPLLQALQETRMGMPRHTGFLLRTLEVEAWLRGREEARTPA